MIASITTWFIAVKILTHCFGDICRNWKIRSGSVIWISSPFTLKKFYERLMYLE